MSDSEARRRPRRVVIADDSPLMRELLAANIAANGDFEVVGRAGTGYEAIRLVHTLKPDALTLDLKMPDLGGLDALAHIAAEMPLPVVIVSAHTRTLADPAVRATIDYGAIEFVAKPEADTQVELTDFRRRLHDALYAAMAARILYPPRGAEVAGERTTGVRSDGPARIAVAIAASTGGPRALTEIVPHLPEDLPAAVFIVQHMPPLFTTSLAKRLDDMSVLPVVEARDETEVQQGTVHVAPGGVHLDLVRGPRGVQVRLTRNPPVWSLRPSADVLFHAVARTFGPSSVSVVLTGMGRDGADGTRAIHAVGGTALVQDESTCVIPSMPRAASPFAEAAVPLDALAAEIAARVRSRARRLA